MSVDKLKLTQQAAAVDGPKTPIGQRYRVALNDIAERCEMLSAQTKRNVRRWLSAWIADSEELFEQQYSDISHDWLPTGPRREAELAVDELIPHVEKDLQRFRETLCQAIELQLTDDATGDGCDDKKHTFVTVRDNLDLVLESVALFQSAPNLSEVVKLVDTSTEVSVKFAQERPHRYHDLNTWEYIIVKQFVSYLDQCGPLFRQLTNQIEE